MALYLIIHVIKIVEFLSMLLYEDFHMVYSKILKQLYVYTVESMNFVNPQALSSAIAVLVCMLQHWAFRFM